MQQRNRQLSRLIQKADVKIMCKVMFGFDLTPSQEEIVRSIAFPQHRFVCINCYTRYGKSQCVALGIALYIRLNRDKRIAIIAPTREQTAIIREYLAELIISNKTLTSWTEFERLNTVARMKREMSKKRWTFKNGCEVRVLSAHGEAVGLMGFGADLVIKDEACLISDTANTKIMRMLGDNPDGSIFVELANPWVRDNKYYAHWNDPEYHNIHVDWRKGVEEGRVSESFVDRMRVEMTPMEFQVLYESRFPDESEDSLFSFSSIQGAIELDIVINKKREYRRIISCDVSEKGNDWTVVYWGYEQEGRYKIVGMHTEPKSDLMQLADKIKEIYEDFGADHINVDCIGLGAGVVSRLKQMQLQCNLNACHFGEKPYDVVKKSPTAEGKIYLNKKAQQYFRLRKILHKGDIDIPDHRKIRGDLMSMRWAKVEGSSRYKIIDPDKSPDFADALVLFCWDTDGQSDWFFG